MTSNEPTGQRNPTEPLPAFRPEGWRDPEIFGRLNAEIEAEKPQRRSRRKRYRKPAGKRVMAALERDVNEFASQLRNHYPALMKRRALPTKKLVLSWLARKLPPLARRSGRPEKSEVTKAAVMKAEQEREIRNGDRKVIDWNKIASGCIAGWASMRELTRNRERNRLRNSVCARQIRADAFHAR